MSLFNVFDIAGTSLSAQSVRLNTIASNLANAGCGQRQAGWVVPAALPGLFDGDGLGPVIGRRGGEGR